MASRFTKSPLVQFQRSLAAQSATKPKPEAQQVHVSKLANGLSVASVPEGNGIATIGFSVKAGSRYEGFDNPGVSHAVRAAIGLSSTNLSGFGITRNIQQCGSNLSAYADRELVLYHSTVLPEKIKKVSDYMVEAVTNPLFRKWEVPKAFDLLKIQVAETNDTAKAVDAFHKAAYFNSGLGNPLICPEYMAGKHSLKDLQAYFEKTHTAERMVLVGVGIEHTLLESLAAEVPLCTGAGPASATKYHGGNHHVDSMGPLAHVIVGAEVISGPVKAKDQIAVYLLQKILGDGQKMKYSPLSGKLPKALGADGFHATNGIFFGYSDSALLGAFIACDGASAGENVSKVAAVLRNINVTEEEFQVAKKVAAIELAELSFDRLNTIDILSYLHHFEGSASINPSDILQTVTLSDVQAIAKKLSNAKLSIGASGRCGMIPNAGSL